MIATDSASIQRFQTGFSLLLTVGLAGCASTAPKTAAVLSAMPADSKSAQVVVSDTEPTIVRPVQAIRMETTGVEGQTSWIIEQDVPTIPKIAGMDAKMPPHIQRRLSYAYDLAQRGGTYSAIAEFQAVLGLCALELDTKENSTRHRDALRDGLIALEEADDFSGNEVDWRDSADIRAVAAGHTTPVLKQQKTTVDSIQAVQAYYTFAEERLAYACSDLACASLAFYGLGRTIVIPDTRVEHASGKAALFHRVALAIAPQNVLAGNELGVLLAQHGLLDDAERTFRHCVATSPSPEAYRNLAAIHARKGDQRASQAALAAGDALAAHDENKRTALAATTPIVVEDIRPISSDEATPKPSYFARLPFVTELPNLLRR
jgi:hypothetical protein